MQGPEPPQPPVDLVHAAVIFGHLVKGFLQQSGLDDTGIGQEDPSGPWRKAIATRFTPEDEQIANVRRFFRSCDRRGLRFACKPRGNWPEELIAELCQELRLIHCVDLLKARAVAAGIAYFRLHGITDYRYRHSEDNLRRLLEVAAGFDETYCLFNNLTMFEEAARFKALAGQTGSRVR